MNTPTILDPIDPEEEIRPEEVPELSKALESFRIDFVPAFSFGRQNISTQDKVYTADALKIEETNKQRPNFVQISNFDREISSWNLSVRQEKQFQTSEGDLLLGASLRFVNTELISIHNQVPPADYPREVELIPGETSQLFKVDTGAAAGTWIYRFGNQESKAESVRLTILGDTMPSARNYQTKFIWTISTTP